MKTDFWIFIGVLAIICVLLYAAKSVPAIATGFSTIGSESMKNTTCDGGCGGGYWHWLLVPLGVFLIIGVVGLVLATIGQKAKP